MPGSTTGPAEGEVILMSAIAIVVVVAVAVIAALTLSLTGTQRRRRLRNRFGPEYDRLVREHESRREAEAELAERERRVRSLAIRPLSESGRAGYARRWEGLQGQFVDMPADTVAASQVLVSEVIAELGYPAGDPGQLLADLSVGHARTIEGYRVAEQISATAAADRASTEDLRQAMIGYRSLFRELLGGPAPDRSGPRRTAERQHPAGG